MTKIVNDANKEAIMTYYKFKDVKVVHQKQVQSKYLNK